MGETLRQLDFAMSRLLDLYEDTKSTEIADAIDILTAYRENYINDHDQYVV